MDAYAELNIETDKLKAFVEERIKRGLSANYEIILAKNKNSG